MEDKVDVAEGRLDDVEEGVLDVSLFTVLFNALSNSKKSIIFKKGYGSLFGSMEASLDKAMARQIAIMQLVVLTVKGAVKLVASKKQKKNPTMQ